MCNGHTHTMYHGRSLMLCVCVCVHFQGAQSDVTFVFYYCGSKYLLLGASDWQCLGLDSAMYSDCTASYLVYERTYFCVSQEYIILLHFANSSRSSSSSSFFYIVCPCPSGRLLVALHRRRPKVRFTCTSPKNIHKHTHHVHNEINAASIQRCSTE